MKNTDKIISEISSHTIKKFEIIEHYVKSWAPKLLNNNNCKKIIFIDCMCNSGEYTEKGTQKTVFGTPVRVTKILNDYAQNYPYKSIEVYFNDNNCEKINHLKTLVKPEHSNIKIEFSCKDGNVRIKELLPLIKGNNNAYLLIYDPYEARIDWEAITPYINNWGEVIINHMLHDSTRAVKVAKTDESKKKYERTYQDSIENLIPFGSDKFAYEKRIEEIISKARQKPKYYIAAFPFFNNNNTIVYNLIHCTGSIKGFILYKKIAWQIFENRSSSFKEIRGTDQIEFNFDIPAENDDNFQKNCYYISDICIFLQKKYNGQSNVPLKNLWETLDTHPIFPSEGFKNQIKDYLKQVHNAKINNTTISFSFEG